LRHFNHARGGLDGGGFLIASGCKYNNNRDERKITVHNIPLRFRIYFTFLLHGACLFCESGDDQISEEPHRCAGDNGQRDKQTQA
ncbi:hypothetical protein, partial [Klebsiella pneumoniae]|uniref:hypothetical protein n=2 Tax=Klebsiella pneumoniae TaxID=573 RepID=UPI003D7EED16